jgi:ribosome biogenesis GTPase A
MQFVPVVHHDEQVPRQRENINTAATRNNKYKIESIAKTYNINVPEGIPSTQKRLAMIIGDQSSGKSSFINYIFCNLEVREVGARAVDSHVHIIYHIS